MTSFVTGASGFIGSHLVKELAAEGDEVVALIHHSRWSKWLEDAMGSDVENTIYVHGDITDYHFLMGVLNQYTPDKVFHLAANAIVKTAHRDPINTFDVNVMGTVKLLEACRQVEVPWVMIQSTDKIYGNQEEAMVHHPYNPTEPYGTSKLCADAIAQSYINTYGRGISIVRPCNIYGYDFNNRIIPNTIRACLAGKDPVIFENDTSLRQYLFIDDFISALLWLYPYVRTRGPVNIGSYDILGQKQVVQEILKFFPDRKPVYQEAPVLKQIRSQSLISSLTGWKPAHTFKEGLKKTIDRFKKYGW